MEGKRGRMESPVIDVDFLAKETFALSEALKGSEEFGQASFFDDFNLKSESSNTKTEIEVEPEIEQALFDESEKELEIEEEVYQEADSAPFPVSTGLVFKIDQSSSTFCVRGLKTLNINETIHDLMCEDEKLLKRLKIREREELSNVHYFETTSIEQAEVISEYIVNRRFPIQEEMVCNLSDPGFSWWYESIDSGFKVFFKAQSVEREKDFIRLGPIGDRLIASTKLASCEGLLRKFFSIAEYSSTEKSFEIKSVNAMDENFLMFKNIFENGKFDLEFNSVELSLEHQRLALFLEEVAAVRGFWISIEELLS
jgi:hypothetical protein